MWVLATLQDNASRESYVFSLSKAIDLGARVSNSSLRRARAESRTEALGFWIPSA